jgi:tRNA A-37 threonylcarbamoyl transferase component Bud32
MNKRNLVLFVGRCLWGIVALYTLALFAFAAVRGYPDYLAQGQSLAPRASEAAAGVLLAVQVIVFLVSFVLATIIFVRRPGDWFAAFFSLVAILAGANSPLMYHLHASDPAWHIPVALVLYIGQALGFACGFLIPNGRFVPRWSRYMALAVCLYMLAAIPFPNAAFSPERLPPILLFVMVLMAGTLVMGLQIYRYREVSTAEERQQTKWLVYGLVVAVCGLIGENYLYLFPASGGLSRVLINLVISPAFHLLILAGPLGLAASILRYRLWDIDFLINRSLVYGTITALVVGLYGASMLAISLVARNFSEGPLVAVVLSAALAGASFQPLRRRIIRFVDRRLYGIQITYPKEPLPVTPPPRATAVIRQTAFGEYENVEWIGRGGMAEVYRAIHPRLQRPVAIKVLSEALSSETGFIARFQREARAGMQLEHPNIVHVYGCGEEEGRYFIVMEYLPGEDLSQYLQKTGRVALPQARPLLCQIASAIDYAHSRGIIHRDIKPSNIRLVQEDEPAHAGLENIHAVLMDFGIARITGGQTALTHPGLIGTLDYIAPEQIQAAPDIDGRADVYALGVMVYQMLTGSLPFQQQNYGALLIAHLTQPAPDPRLLAPELSPKAARAILKAMEKKREDRWESAGEFVEAMQPSSP